MKIINEMTVDFPDKIEELIKKIEEKSEYAGVVKAMDRLKCEDCDGAGGEMNSFGCGPCSACDGSGWNDEMHETTCEDLFDEILKT